MQCNLGTYSVAVIYFKWRKKMRTGVTLGEFHLTKRLVKTMGLKVKKEMLFDQKGFHPNVNPYYKYIYK